MLSIHPIFGLTILPYSLQILEMVYNLEQGIACI